MPTCKSERLSIVRLPCKSSIFSTLSNLDRKTLLKARPRVTKGSACSSGHLSTTGDAFVLLHAKASLNAPYSHASSRLYLSLRVFIKSGDEQLRFVRIQQVKLQVFCALLTDMRGIMFFLQESQPSLRAFTRTSIVSRARCRLFRQTFEIGSTDVRNALDRRFTKLHDSVSVSSSCYAR